MRISQIYYKTAFICLLFLSPTAQANSVACFTSSMGQFCIELLNHRHPLLPPTFSSTSIAMPTQTEFFIAAFPVLLSKAAVSRLWMAPAEIRLCPLIHFLRSSMNSKFPIRAAPSPWQNWAVIPTVPPANGSSIWLTIPPIWTIKTVALRYLGALFSMAWPFSMRWQSCP